MLTMKLLRSCFVHITLQKYQFDCISVQVVFKAAVAYAVTIENF